MIISAREVVDSIRLAQQALERVQRLRVDVERLEFERAALRAQSEEARRLLSDIALQSRFAPSEAVWFELRRRAQLRVRAMELGNVMVSTMPATELQLDDRDPEWWPPIYQYPGGMG